MTDDTTLTPAQAESLGALSAELLQVMFNFAHANPDLDVSLLVAAGCITIRVVAETALCEGDTTRSPTAVRMMMAHQFGQVMMLPPNYIKRVKTDDDGPHQAGFMPVKRH